MRKIAKILGIENLGFGIRETTLCAVHIFHFLFSLGAVHKLRLQEEGGRWSKKNRLFVNFYTIENVNGGG